MAKDSRDSRDYKGFEDKVAGDLSKASLQAQSLGGGKKSANTQKMRIRDSDMPKTVPPGSTIEFEQITFHKLKFGDIVFCRFDKELCIRRFIRIKMMKSGNAEMHVTREGPDNMVQILPGAALVGRITTVEFKGQMFDPRKLEGGLAAFQNYLTEYGTTTPLERIMRNWHFFKSMMKK